MFVIVMGVSGSGKSSIGRMLADRLGWPFYDGDDFHSPENVAKMAAGVPLTDEDRAAWLDQLATFYEERHMAGENGVIACSVLKKAYRDTIRRTDRKHVRFVYLKGSYDVILERMKNRGEHFMKADMLKSQFDILEEPWGNTSIDVTLSKEEIVQKIIEQVIDVEYALGVIGLGVMGRSLALNFVRNCYPVVAYDLAPRLPDEFDVKVVDSPKEVVRELTPPRTIFLMLPAGVVVDNIIASLKPHLQAGDLIIDGGNSHFKDTARRVKELEEAGIHFIGMGLAGGHREGLWGPSLMPGGALEAWSRVEPMFQAIAAKTPDGKPCVAWMGSGGAGHYVKMVHDGIEYAVMQQIAEIYDLLHRGAGLSNQELAGVFARWNRWRLRSYLIEITAAILRQEDGETGQTLVDLIRDEAAQKGTGRWNSQTALDAGIPIPTINAAVESRLISNLKPERVAVAKAFGRHEKFTGDKGALIAAAEQALYASTVISFAQGISLLQAVPREYGWALDICQIIQIWRGGSILRAAILDDIFAAYDRYPNLTNLLLDGVFKTALFVGQSDWREIVQTAVRLGIPMLAIGASLGYFDSYRSDVLPANLTQAQRDYFGAHTYQRVDRAGSFHTDWEKHAA